MVKAKGQDPNEYWRNAGDVKKQSKDHQKRSFRLPRNSSGGKPTPAPPTWNNG